MTKNIRPEVEAFLAVAPLPASEAAEPAQIRRIEEALHRITSPVTREEAIRLATAFGLDDCFGLASTLLHLIESAPGGLPPDALPSGDSEWVVLLRERISRGR